MNFGLTLHNRQKRGFSWTPLDCHSVVCLEPFIFVICCGSNELSDDDIWNSYIVLKAFVSMSALFEH